MTESSLLLPGETLIEAGEKVRLITNGRGLRWGTDAYLLAAYLRPMPGKRACELGCGTGVVSFLAAAHGKYARVTAVELNPTSADQARRGVAVNGLDDRVTVLERDIRTLRFTDPDVGGRFAAVFSNPPYIAHPGTESTDSVAAAARHELNGGIDDFCAAAARLLGSGGSFYTVFRPERLCDLFCALRAHRLEPKRMTLVYPDADSAPSVVLVESRLDAAPRLETAPPLIFFRDPPSVPSRRMTEQAARIYRNCDFSVREENK